MPRATTDVANKSRADQIQESRQKGTVQRFGVKFMGERGIVCSCDGVISCPSTGGWITVASDFIGHGARLSAASPPWSLEPYLYKNGHDS